MQAPCKLYEMWEDWGERLSLDCDHQAVGGGAYISIQAHWNQKAHTCQWDDARAQ